MDMSSLTEYEDRVHGFRLRKPAEWVVDVRAGCVSAVNPAVPLVSCGFQLARAGSSLDALRAYLDYEERYFRALVSPGLHVSLAGRWWGRGRSGVAVRSLYRASGPLLQVFGLGIEVDVECYAFMACAPGGFYLTSSCSLPAELKERKLDVLMAVLSSFELREPLPVRAVAFPDLSRGMAAYVAKAPQGWHVSGGVQGMSFAAELTAPGGEMRVAVEPAVSYVYDASGSIALQLTGLPISPYMDALSYVRGVLPQLGLRVEWARAEGLSSSLFSEYMGALLSSPASGLRPIASSSLAKFSSEGALGYAWAATFGVALGSLVGWSAQVSTAMGRGEGEASEALGVLRGFVGSIVANPTWLKTVLAEYEARQRAERRMRAIIMQDAMESARHWREMYEMTRRTYDEIRRMRLETWRANMLEDLTYTHGWCNAISGTIDVRDPDTGEVYKIDDVAQEYWMDTGHNLILATEAHEEPPELPGVQWRKLDKSLRGFPEQF